MRSNSPNISVYTEKPCLFTVSSINVLCDAFLYNVESTDVLSTSICMHMLFRILQYAFNAKYAANASNLFLCNSDSAMSQNPPVEVFKKSSLS